MRHYIQICNLRRITQIPWYHRRSNTFENHIFIILFYFNYYVSLEFRVSVCLHGLRLITSLISNQVRTSSGKPEIGYNYLFILKLKLKHVNKRGLWRICLRCITLDASMIKLSPDVYYQQSNDMHWSFYDAIIRPKTDYSVRRNPDKSILRNPVNKILKRWIC